MLEREKSFVCSTCDVCREPKNVEFMCTQMLNPTNPAEPEKVCWCVCQDCLPVIESVDQYYEECFGTK